MVKINNASQEFVNIKEIKDNVVIKKDEGMFVVMLASSINFSLKSLEEQQAILQQFRNFLNSLEFSIQICVQSRRLNIKPYLDILRGMENNQDNNLMRTQLREYIEFIDTFTKEVDVMSKNFFVVIPYSPINVNLTKNFAKIFGKKKRDSTQNSKEYIFKEHKIQLEQRMSVVSEGLSRVGIRTVTLNKDSLVELFYHTYNPGDITGSAPTQQ